MTLFCQVMLPTRRLTFRDAYCSAPPLESSLRPPRLSCDTEAVRPRAPLWPTKREVRESEASSAEFVLEKDRGPCHGTGPKADLREASRRLHQSASPGSLLILRARRVQRTARRPYEGSRPAS